jgi:hypothetical protein
MSRFVHDTVLQQHPSSEILTEDEYEYEDGEEVGEESEAEDIEEEGGLVEDALSSNPTTSHPTAQRASRLLRAPLKPRAKLDAIRYQPY